MLSRIRQLQKTACIQRSKELHRAIDLDAMLAIKGCIGDSGKMAIVLVSNYVGTETEVAA